MHTRVCYCNYLKIQKPLLLSGTDEKNSFETRRFLIIPEKGRKKRWRKKSIQLKIVKIHTKTWNWLQFGANSKKVSSSKLPHSHVLYLVIVISRFDFKKRQEGELLHSKNDLAKLFAYRSFLWIFFSMKFPIIYAFKLFKELNDIQYKNIMLRC